MRNRHLQVHDKQLSTSGHLKEAEQIECIQMSHRSNTSASALHSLAAVKTVMCVWKVIHRPQSSLSGYHIASSCSDITNTPPRKLSHAGTHIYLQTVTKPTIEEEAGKNSMSGCSGSPQVIGPAAGWRPGPDPAAVRPSCTEQECDDCSSSSSSTLLEEELKFFIYLFFFFLNQAFTDSTITLQKNHFVFSCSLCYCCYVPQTETRRDFPAVTAMKPNR